MLGHQVDTVIGRDTELGLLGDLVAEVVAGRGRSLLIEGESGIGKSALLAAGLGQAEAAGCQVLSGCCDELGQRFPLSVMKEILGADAGPADPRPAETEPNGWNARFLAGDPVAAASEQLLALVVQLCTAGPVVLAVEDLQWADEATLVLWRRLCRASAQLPLLVIGTCRLVPRHEELERLRRQVRAQSGALIPLSRLAEESVSKLARRLTGGAPGARLLERLESAGGNPLYVRELLDALSRVQALRVVAGVADLTPGDRGFAGVLSLARVIADRLDFLSVDAQETLRVAALLGPEFSVADLAVVTGRGQGGLLTVMEEALTAGVLESAGPRLRFRHGLLKEALYEAMPTALRGALRLHAAQLLSASGAPVERVAALILPAVEMADGWEWDWVAEHAPALAGRAPAVAAEMLEQGLRHTAESDPRYAVLEDQLTSVCFLLSRDDETERLARGILVRSTEPQRVSQAAWLLIRVMLRAGRYVEVLAQIGAATADLRGGPVLRARLDALRSVALCLLGRTAEATQEAARALAAGERLADPAAMAAALHASSMLRYREGDQAGSIILIDRALALIGSDSHLLDLRLTLLIDRVTGLDRLNRFQESASTMSLARTLAERIGTPRLGTVLLRVAEKCFKHGRWKDALAELDEITALPKGHFSLIQHGLMALISAHRDEWPAAAAHLDAWGDTPIPPGWPNAAAYLLMARALAAERAGRPQEAVRVLGVLLTPPYEEGMATRSDWLPTLVRLALAADDQQTARAATLACQREAAHEPLPRKQAAAQWCAGLLHADPAALLAATVYQRIADRRPALGNALEDTAVVQAINGDLNAARATMAEALAVYTELGAAWDSRRAAARLRPYGLRPCGLRTGARPRPSSGWDALTVTERRVAELVSKGRSNRDIADHLQLSRRTVETHVSHILSKLQARSRKEITDFAQAGD